MPCSASVRACESRSRIFLGGDEDPEESSSPAGRRRARCGGSCAREGRQGPLRPVRPGERGRGPRVAPGEGLPWGADATVDPAGMGTSSPRSPTCSSIALERGVPSSSQFVAKASRAPPDPVAHRTRVRLRSEPAGPVLLPAFQLRAPRRPPTRAAACGRSGCVAT